MSLCNVSVPCVTFVIAAHDARNHIARTIESLIASSSREFSLVIVDCDSTDGTRDMCEAFAAKDVRVDVVGLDSSDIRVGRDAGVNHARAPYVAFLDADEWLAPGSVENIVSAVKTTGRDLYVPCRQFDRYDARGDRHSRLSDYSGLSARSRAELGGLLPVLIGQDVFECVSGLIVRRALFAETGICCADAASDCVLALECAGAAESLETVPGALCHTTEVPVAGAYDPRVAEQLSVERSGYIELANRWGVEGDSDVRCALSRRHFKQLVACIENVCLSPQAVSSSERNARVKDIVESAEAQQTIRELHGQSRDLGFMYGPIAKKNVAACCMGAWASNLLHPAMCRAQVATVR